MKTKVVVDRFEGERAVLLVGEEETAVSWFRRWLPENVREGDVLAISIDRDEAATQTAKETAESLLKELLAEQPEQK